MKKFLKKRFLIKVIILTRNFFQKSQLTVLSRLYILPSGVRSKNAMGECKIDFIKSSCNFLLALEPPKAKIAPQIVIQTPKQILDLHFGANYILTCYPIKHRED